MKLHDETRLSVIQSESITEGDYELLKKHFDINFYVRQVDLKLNENEAILHYINEGWRNGLDPSPIFSTINYISSCKQEDLGQTNPFLHYLVKERNYLLKNSQIESIGTNNEFHEAAASEYSLLTENIPELIDDKYEIVAKEIDLPYYRKIYPDLEIAERDHGLDLIEHYINQGGFEGRNPHIGFDSEYYLERNRDVKDAKINPFVHFIRYGRKEGRSCLPDVNPVNSYTKESSNIVSANNIMIAGETEIWSGYEDVQRYAFEEDQKDKFDKEILSFTIAYNGMNIKDVLIDLRSKLNCEITANPDFSIIIPCIDQWTYTAECISSVAGSMKEGSTYEIIIIDNGSTQPFYNELKELSGLILIRNEINVGFGKACNQAAAIARGRFLFFLNNDAQVYQGSIELLHNELNSSDSIGAVVPKVMSFDGTLQEAGCLITRNGQGKLIGYGKDHRSPKYNYKRKVYYGSAVAFLMRSSLFKELGGFDDIYAPAYYEDADLCMKINALGKSILYVPNALVAHHLSKSSSGAAGNDKKMALIVKNQQTFIERWKRELLREKLRLVAFYLPQYHPIPENDAWWGKGFTEWSNLTNATANFVGHRQPRRPSTFGYYDLRRQETMEEQAKLATRYGISGFCYYYYWFAGKRLLERPLEQMLATGKPDFPFCLCWANENWTRTWDGQNNNVLIAQDYTEENDIAVIKDLARYFSSKNYIKIDGKPLILVYRVKNLPLFYRTAAVWRNYAAANGIGDLVIAAVESFELSALPEDPQKFGCDITVEFPPHQMVHDNARKVEVVNPKYTGTVHDYRALAREYMVRQEPGWSRIRSVLVGWDNTPRRQNNSLVLENGSPGAFQAWLEWTIERTLEQNLGDERIVFINAWNEWCEGSYLEPDQDYGHAYLQAVKNALDNIM